MSESNTVKQLSQALNQLLDAYEKLQKEKKNSYFYIDPPFSIREGMEDIYDKMIHLIANLPSSVVQMIIIEHMTGLEIDENLGEFCITKVKKFGNTSLTYLTPKDELEY